MNFGDWELQAWESISDPQLQVWFNDWVNEKPTNGESFKDLYIRVMSFLNEQLSKEQTSIAIFAHAGVIRAAVAYLNKLELGSAFDFKVEFGEIVTVDHSFF
jgi:alpha-ribazole phosphatase